MPDKKKRVLLHACCAPCLSYSIEKLMDDGYEVVAYFFNPNIHPDEEYVKRRDEFIIFCKNKDYDYILEDESPQRWFELTDDFKDEKEGGKRCSVCFDMRLLKAAEVADEKGFDYFCTTLTISPHKNTKVINEIGVQIAKKYNADFLEENFKKKDGFKKSLLISKEHNLFRQTYCGCIYSIR